MIKVILPKTFVDLTLHPNQPLFYLGGPILGADDWQDEACRWLEVLVPDCFIATPRRYGAKSVLWHSRVRGIEDYFPRQLLWEREYMRLAGSGERLGCLLFWLCCENSAAPRNDGNPYAMDTRGELGEWRGLMMNWPGAHVVIGAEKAFPGLDEINTNFSKALGYDFPLYDSLEETVKQAVKCARAGWSEAA